MRKGWKFYQKGTKLLWRWRATICTGHNNLKLAGTWKFQNDNFFINHFYVHQVQRLSFCPLRRLKIIDPMRTPSSGERCTVTRPTLFVIFMVYHYV